MKLILFNESILESYFLIISYSLFAYRSSHLLPIFITVIYAAPNINKTANTFAMLESNFFSRSLKFLMF